MKSPSSDLFIGPCAACGRPLEFKAVSPFDPFWNDFMLHNEDADFDPYKANDAEWRSYMRDTQEVLLEANPMAAKYISNIAKCLICSACLQLSEKTRNEWIQNQKQERAAEYLQNNGLWTAEYLEHNFKDSDPTQKSYSADAWKVAEAWTAKKSNLWIMGNSGRGKTYMAHCILNRELERAHTIAHLTCYSLDNEGHLYDWQKTKLRHYKMVDVLLLDDIDKPEKNESYRVLMDILETRNANKRRTLVTANKTPDAFKAFLTGIFQHENQSIPAAFLDRLNWRNCVCERLEIKGASMRRNAAQPELIGSHS